MSSRKYLRKFHAANKRGFGGRYRSLRGILKKYRYRKRDILGRRAIDTW